MDQPVLTTHSRNVIYSHKREIQLDKANLRGNFHGFEIAGQSNIRLLLAIGSNQGVDLEGIDTIKLLDGFLDLTLVGLNVAEEDQGVGFFHLLHGGFGVDGGDDDIIRGQARRLGD